jgi:hypothetical protein
MEGERLRLLAAPVANLSGKSGRESQAVVGVGEPAEPAIGR